MTACSKAKKAQPVTPKVQSSYTPVVALFSTAGLMALATSLGMTGFMGISLGMLASLKLMDLYAIRFYSPMVLRWSHG